MGLQDVNKAVDAMSWGSQTYTNGDYDSRLPTTGHRVAGDRASLVRKLLEVRRRTPNWEVTMSYRYHNHGHEQDYTYYVWENI